MPDKEARSRVYKGRIADARGQVVTQLDPVALRLLVRHDTIPAEPLRLITEELDPGEVRRRWRGLVLGVIGSVGCIVGGLLYLRFISSSGIGRWRDPVLLTFGAVYIVGPPIIVFIKFRLVRRARRDRIRRVMLAHLRCPHCGYDLRGLPVDSGDGATVCPECGCGWLLAADSPGME